MTSQNPIWIRHAGLKASFLPWEVTSLVALSHFPYACQFPNLEGETKSCSMNDVPCALGMQCSSEHRYMHTHTYILITNLFKGF